MEGAGPRSLSAAEALAPALRSRTTRAARVAEQPVPEWGWVSVWLRALQRRPFPLGFPRQLLPIVGAEESLPQPDRLRGDLDQLVVFDILKSAL